MPTTEYLPYSGTHACADIDTTIDEVRTARGNESSLNARISADVSTLNTAIATKANSSDVTSALALKADSSSVTAALAEKADADDVASSLATKADSATVAEELATKANTDDVTSALSSKADASDLSALSSEVSDARVGGGGTTYQSLSSRLDSEYSEIKGAIEGIESGLDVELNPATMIKTDNYSLYPDLNGILKATYAANYTYKTCSTQAGKKYKISGSASGYRIYFGTSINSVIPE